MLITEEAVHVWGQGVCGESLWLPNFLWILNCSKKNTVSKTGLIRDLLDREGQVRGHSNWHVEAKCKAESWLILFECKVRVLHLDAARWHTPPHLFPKVSTQAPWFEIKVNIKLGRGLFLWCNSIHRKESKNIFSLIKDLLKFLMSWRCLSFLNPIPCLHGS